MNRGGLSDLSQYLLRRRGDPSQRVGPDVQQIVDAVLGKIPLRGKDGLRILPVVVKAFVAPRSVQGRRSLRKALRIIFFREGIVALRRIVPEPIAQPRIDKAVRLTALDKLL